MSHMTEALVVPRFDTRLGRYMERIDVDLESLNHYAQEIGIADVVDARAEHSKTKPQPITINFHSGYLIDSLKNTRGIMAGVYHLTPSQYGSMPAADIDIFVGSDILMARTSDTHDEREAAATTSLNHSIQEELLHCSDPRIRLGGEVYDYLEPAEDDPEIAKQESRKDLLEQQVIDRATGTLALSLFLSAVPFVATSESGLPYSRELAPLSGVAAFLTMGSLGLRYLVKGKALSFLKADNELTRALYEASKYETFVKSRIDAHGPKELASLHVESFARRNIPRNKTAVRL
jgi:hypothetical protein